MAQVEVKVPDLGDFAAVEVIEILVASGDVIGKNDSLITLETDKAAMDVPSPAAGTVAGLALQVGDKVSQGDLILTLETAQSGSDAAPDKTPGDESTAATPATTAPAAAPSPRTEAATPAAPAAPREEIVRVPDIGDFSGVDVIEVFVQTGEEIAAQAPLVTLETDKAAMDVPSPFAGTVLKFHMKVGDKVSEGDEIAVLEVATSSAKAPAEAPASSAAGNTAPGGAQKLQPGGLPGTPTAPRVAAPAAGGRAPARTQLPPIDEASFKLAHAGPSVRRFARELGVDLGSVTGSGHKKRITRDDVKAFVKSVLSGGISAAPSLPQVPKVDFARFGEIEVRALTRIQKISGPRLHASWVNVPHVTQHDEADTTDLEALRKSLKEKAAEQGVKLTPLAFILKASALALREFPVFASSLDPTGENLVFKKYIHVGFAADTPNGLMVPVIRDVDNKDVFAIARELGELSALARDGKLKADQMQGGCFTVSSLGGIGGTAFTPIVNAPEVAILGVSRSRMTPVYVDGDFVPRLMLPLSLSYDHRVIDGAAAVRFTTWLGKTLAAPTQLVAGVGGGT